MGPSAGYAFALWPWLLYFAGTLLTVAAILLTSHLLGQRRTERLTAQPYESGIPPTGTARLRMSAKFYLVAMFFVVFDLEAAFIFAWVIAFREAGWPGYIAMLSFIGTLVAALIYLWRQGALDWAPHARTTPGAPR